MARELKEYIGNLQRVTAEKERIGAELSVAANIQANMLPRIFPPFPDRAEFDIYASMLPAKEVGGDFYDFFFVNESALAVIVADVSGKGVPAALFMVIAKTLLKNNAQSGKSPREVFEKVNNILCEGNDTGMFVTAFMGYLNVKTGKFTYVNAGHNPPILRTNGSCGLVKVKPGFVLAGIENISFKEDDITLRDGDGIFLYTDGITEAVNGESEMFGRGRLIEAADSYMGLPPHEFTASIMVEIGKFTAGAEQADDITMLALRYKK
jgi:sigma-B regulation protein RsbU (phosphoserine phosphatase)